MRGRGRCVVQLLEADRPVDERGGVGADDHHLVADRLHRRARRRAASPRRLDEALDRRRPPPPPRPPPSAACSRRGRRTRSRRAAGRGRRRPSTSTSMWPTTSCSTKCRRKRWWTWSMIGEASGSSSRASPSISSAISRPGHAVAHQRLVDVEVEEPHLGVGDLRERLAVHAHELQQARRAGSPRRAPRRRSAAAARSSSGMPLERARREAERQPDAARSAPARARSRAPPRRA